MTVIKVLTLAWFVLSVDGLSLVYTLIVLNTHQMGVCLRAEVCCDGHDVLVRVVDDFHHLIVHEETNRTGPELCDIAVL